MTAPGPSLLIVVMVVVALGIAGGRLDNSGNCVLRAEGALRPVGQGKLLESLREGTPSALTNENKHYLHF